MKLKYINLIFAIFVSTVFLGNIAVADDSAHAHSTKAVEAKKVCMVNDKFMGIDQIPIEVNKKTYYGCCNNCIAKLQNNESNVRFAQDPFTREQVDKADAYIVTIEDKSNKVLYFKSEQNYQEYIKNTGDRR